ncbi:phosphonoacetaldehyde hydrolase [Enterococcus saccharolyticus]|uniref:Phosphonoacetaldehyde hydrolase n=1 Tax=Candidatus Enterococcus willemsii TaxID=1857215 RepID=A0ABQ6Z1C0_9ENTE|nr:MULTISPECIES: phosphonoacetaldehyde hydrolase [Enterococcus]KAF1305166.1 phosphonoacetaldehyde hydrolase [Enterococcus sp. CU12B]MCD5003189.1 phosphonoacetaldehyde hydrolase [Enterococcus saccharolyticus]
MINTVILDWAGTTVDFGCMAPVDAFYQAFKKEGIEVTNAEIRLPMGTKKHDHIMTMLKMDRIAKEWLAVHGDEPTEADIHRIYQTFEDVVFQTLDQYSDVKPGVLDVVQQLKAMNISIGSTTGYTNEMMEIVAKVAAEQGYEPDYIATPDMTQGVGRPAPYMIFRILEHFGTLSVKNAVKIGDTISDIEEGKNAGLFSIGLIEGSSLAGYSFEEYQQLSEVERQELYDKVRKEYLDAGADVVIETLAELPQLIVTLNQENN